MLWKGNISGNGNALFFRQLYARVSSKGNTCCISQFKTLLFNGARVLLDPFKGVKDYFFASPASSFPFLRLTRFKLTPS